jgi:HEPN domain-containing protein
MKKPIDFARGLCQKAESDMETARILFEAGRTPDTVCFHAQQVVEKYLKAYLVWKDVEYPHVHDIEKLLVLCEMQDASFSQFAGIGRSLNPYAVELRYDELLLPTTAQSDDALHVAEALREFVTSKLPANNAF